MNLEELNTACQILAASHSDLAEVYATYGCPPLWDREPSFASLIHIILEQQVSLASAAAAFKKLGDKLGEITPENLLKLTDKEMKACYFSRQKTGYARNLAQAILKQELVLFDLSSMPDDQVRAELIKIKGIGIWTSDIFLIMALLRPDIMPTGDIALYTSYKELNGLAKAPGRDEFAEIAAQWAPYRSAAARLLWHYYLSRRGKSY